VSIDRNKVEYLSKMVPITREENAVKEDMRRGEKRQGRRSVRLLILQNKKRQTVVEPLQLKQLRIDRDDYSIGK
jgi:hypothetical protein